MAASDELDLEMIASFIDGKLTGADRARVIELLGNSDAALEIYSDALHARDDLGEADVIPISAAPRRRVRSWLVGVPMAAAAALLIAILPTIQARRGRGTLDLPLASIAGPVITAGTTDLATALGQRWDDHQWSVMRGGGPALVISTTAFRLGVRAADLHVALHLDERDRAGRTAGEMLDLLQAVSLADGVRDGYADVRTRIRNGQSTDQILPASARAERDLDALLASPQFGIGKWFGMGEIAARAHSAAFFASPETARFLEWAVEHGRLAPGDAELLRQVGRFAGKSLTADDFDTIAQEFTELIRRHGG